MSKIKIRGYHTQLKKMFLAEEMARDQLTILPTGEFINVSSLDESLSHIFPVDKFIPMLWTGVRDEEGTEVYAEDIVKFKAFESEEYRYGVVEYDTYKFIIKNKGGMIVDREDMIGKVFTHPNNCHLKVIGNIYQNPELMDKGDK